MFSRSFILTSALALSAVLGGCSYATGGPTQEITFLTPGAHNAVCYVHIDAVKYKVRPPKSLIVKRSAKDMMVDCQAPGNRQKKIFIRPDLEKSFFGNAANAGAGVPWDALTESMFGYPDIVEINFTHTPVRPEAMPAQNQPDLRPPEDYLLEEYKPGLPRLNDDRFNVPNEVNRRQRGAKPSARSVRETVSTSDAMDSKSNPMPVIDTYGGVIDPSGDPTPAVGGPVPLFPGE